VVLLATGAAMPSAACNKVSDAVAKSDLNAFFGKALKVLWPQHSTMCNRRCDWVRNRGYLPFAAGKTVIIFRGVVPVVSATLVYLFIGNFIGGHIFLAREIAAIFGGLLSPGSR
jgi:hypothetical protein